jgi:hypothetical protein
MRWKRLTLVLALAVLSISLFGGIEGSSERDLGQISLSIGCMLAAIFVARQYDRRVRLVLIRRREKIRDWALAG